MKGESKQNFAVKIMAIDKLKDSVKDQLREELAVLSKLDHPYISKYESSFEDKKYIYLVME